MREHKLKSERTIKWPNANSLIKKKKGKGWERTFDQGHTDVQQAHEQILKIISH